MSLFAALVLAAVGPSVQGLSEPGYSALRLRNLRFRTRDGVILVADAFRPEERGRYPVILERTPFGRETVLANGEFWARRGYVYVAQDCRGRGSSGGEFDLFSHEGTDGAETVAWLARQAWSNGNVGMIGEGLGATSLWLTAAERPAALKCLVPESPVAGFPYENGIFDLGRSLRFAQLFRPKRTDNDVSLANPSGVSHLPLREVDRAALKRKDAFFQRCLEQSPAGWFGKLFDRVDQFALPSLNLSEWGESRGTRYAWEALRKANDAQSWLVYGPWKGKGVDAESLTLQFFDTYLKGQSVGMGAVPRVQAFVEGADKWVTLDGWPSTSSSFDTLYLAPGALTVSPGASGAAVFVYDPGKDGADKSKPSLFFKGEPLTKATAIAGPFEVRLFFKSSAADTDLFATLVDLDSAGHGRPIGEAGRLRASLRDPSAPAALEPGSVYAVTLRPGEGAYEVPVGHRIALLINSSAFPETDRNLGGASQTDGTKTVSQRNVILTGAITPSRITFRRLW